MIASPVCINIMNIKSKEKQLKTVWDLTIIKTRPDDGRKYLIIQRKSISSSTYEGLIDKLYDYFFGDNAATMGTYFETWMEWREKETSVSKKTIKENRFKWSSLLKDQDISLIPSKDLSAKDLIMYFRNITKGRQITRKRFNDLKSNMNGIPYLAVENDIIERNCLRDINYKQFCYKSENTRITTYTEKERLKIINQLGNDFYSLVIKLDFYLFLRICELKGLRWDDISGDSLYFQRFEDDRNEIIKDIKGHAGEGKRYMPLTPKAKKILVQIRALNPGSEYIFIRNGQPLATVTFNRGLKKCCEELGIKYRSAHNLRFSTASIMYKNGMEDTELQKLLGYTSLNMTHHYFRNITSQEETASEMRTILD